MNFKKYLNDDKITEGKFKADFKDHKALQKLEAKLKPLSYVNNGKVISMVIPNGIGFDSKSSALADDVCSKWKVSVDMDGKLVIYLQNYSKIKELPIKS